MKKILLISFFTVVFILSKQSVLIAKASENFYLDGTVICPVGGDKLNERPAKNIIVEPDNNVATPAITEESGVYRLVIPREYIGSDGKYINLDCLKIENDKPQSVCSISREFIGPDRLSGETNDIVRFETIELNKSCDKAEGKYSSAKSYVNEKQRTAETASKGWVPSMMTLLAPLAEHASSLATAVTIVGSGTGSNPKTLDLNSISERTVTNGQFLDYSLNTLSLNVGFNFSPQRVLSESVFWNPARMVAASDNIVSVSLSTYPLTYLRTAGVIPLNSGLSVGFGFIRLKQEEERTATYGTANAVITDSFVSRESAAYISFGQQLTKDTSVGLAIKRIVQRNEFPSNVPITATPSPDGLIRIDDKLARDIQRKSFEDVDISISHLLSPSLKLGANIMNIGDPDMFIDKDSEVSLRSVGLGAVFLHNQFNFGVDYLLKEGRKDAVSIGADYVPLNDMRVNMGYSTDFQSRTVGLEYHGFTVLHSHSTSLKDRYQIGFRTHF